MMRWFGAMVVAAGLLVAPAAANDSTAALDAGGLVYTTNSVIRIDSETLTISAKEVHVAYDFTNTSDAELTTLVAFPLPDLTFDGEWNYAVEPTDPVNWMSFRLWVDGESQRLKAHLRARRFGVDVTDVLKRHGLPVILLYRGPEEAAALDRKMKGLSMEARDELVRYGLVDWTSQWGADNQPLPTFHWTASLSFYWFQTFPAHRTIHVEHRYKPVPGYSFAYRELLDDPDFGRRFCVGDALKRAFDKVARVPDGGGGAMMGAADIRYVLRTGANWLGPIGRFRLVFDKGEAGNLVSTCFKGLKPQGKTELVFESENFEPQDDLHFLLLQPPATGE